MKPVLFLLGLLVATSAIRAQGAPDSGLVYAEERLTVLAIVLRQPPAVYRDSLTKAPALLHGPTLDYPMDLREHQIQGRVVVQMIIDTLGRPEPGSIQFVELPDEGFRFSVTQYLAGVWFRPALRAGRPVRFIVYLPIDFRLRGSLFPCPVNVEFGRGCRP
ncbi:MAG TPA: energy transducer TonB [Gemmatimonadales bacterium]|nr:energy transducer TonB [Gemmatimonadales bacterium]